MAHGVKNLSQQTSEKCETTLKSNTGPLTFTQLSVHSFTFLCIFCIDNWRASEASETLSGVYKFELMRYVYIYICMEVCVP